MIWLTHYEFSTEPCLTQFSGYGQMFWTGLSKTTRTWLNPFPKAEDGFLSQWIQNLFIDANAVWAV